MMLKLVVASLLVSLPVAWSKTCTVCKTEYDTDKSTAGSNNTLKCTALSSYLTCLGTSAKSDAGCPLSDVNATAIETDYTDASCSTPFTDTCVCQKTFWATHQANESAICTEATKYVACLKGTTGNACDGILSPGALVGQVETRMNALNACNISAACQCEINVMKADMSTDTKKCTAYKAQFSCLYGVTTEGTCDSGTILSVLKTTAAASVTGATSCSFDDTCACQRSYDAAAMVSIADKCTAYKAELSCLSSSKTPTGCDGTTAKSAIATTAETARASLANTSCPAPTSTCQCEIDAAKGDNSDSTKYCKVLTTLKTCLSLITNTTEPGCTAVTQAALVISTDTKYTSTQCAADHVTFVMTSLVFSLLATVFL